MQKQNFRLAAIETALILAAGALVVQLFRIIRNDQAMEASARQGNYTLQIPLSTGIIYDKDFTRITNDKELMYAVLNPTPDAVASVFGTIKDHDAFTKQLRKQVPFYCEVNENIIANPNVKILNASETSPFHLAQHLIGYRQNGIGVSGLEVAYSDWLTSCDVNASVTFSVNAVGGVLAGLESEAIKSGTPNGGVVTTLSKPIQRITETALRAADPNPAAAVVLDVNSGAIIAMASIPSYDPEHLAEALTDENAPFLNRALCAYPVGSVFKLVIAAAALENGMTTEYMYDCIGKTEIYHQPFRCHNTNGHGILDMRSAMVCSCNPYFITLSQLLSPSRLHDTAAAFGFGNSIFLADGISSAAGYLQSETELKIEAEKANFSFGQGKLLATPLQIAAMTACIANDGIYYTPWLVRGLTEDGGTLIHEYRPSSKNVLKEKTARTLQSMMAGVLTENKNHKGLPRNITAGGKTSTAQTGQFSDRGMELCHGWMTGFFPLESPRYAVTVFVENGGSGNQSAAPIFREIIDHIAQMESD